MWHSIPERFKRMSVAVLRYVQGCRGGCELSVQVTFCAVKRLWGKIEKFLLYKALIDVYSAPHFGSVAERLKAPVLKTGDPKGF